MTPVNSDKLCIIQLVYRATTKNAIQRRNTKKIINKNETKKYLKVLRGRQEKQKNKK